MDNPEFARRYAAFPVPARYGPKLAPYYTVKPRDLARIYPGARVR